MAAEGGWIVLGSTLGAIIGAASSVFTTWLTARLERDKLDSYDRATMSILKEALEKGDNWQHIGGLADIIGASEDDTKQLLIMLGARARQTQAGMWGLRSRNPLPDRIG